MNGNVTLYYLNRSVVANKNVTITMDGDKVTGLSYAKPSNLKAFNENENER